MSSSIQENKKAFSLSYKVLIGLFLVCLLMMFVQMRDRRQALKASYPVNALIQSWNQEKETGFAETYRFVADVQFKNKQGQTVERKFYSPYLTSTSDPDSYTLEDIPETGKEIELEYKPQTDTLSVANFQNYDQQIEITSMLSILILAAMGLLRWMERFLEKAAAKEA